MKMYRLSEMLKDIFRKSRYFFRDFFINKKKRKNTKKRDFSIIASDCTGGMVLHDLKMRFNSPTVNMFFMASDFLEFCKDIKHYMDMPMEEVAQTEYPYPICTLGGVITIHLVHYKSVEEAQRKWNERKQRINWDNLYFIMNDRNECEYDIMSAFDALPFKNKVLFTHDAHPELSCAYQIKGFQEESCVGVMTSYNSRFSLKRIYDQFDFVKWINGEYSF